jgi:hypothetical protein
MSVTGSELIQYLATDHPEDDTSTLGGAINAAGRPFDADLASNSQLEVLSDGADTRTITVRYRDAAGIVQTTGAVTLSGTTPVALGVTAERLIEATMSTTDASRTVTLRIAGGGATQHTFNPNETKARRLFALAVSSSSGKVYYEKTFWKNTDSVTALLGATMKLTADPSGKIKMGIAVAQGGTTSSTNRLTAPSGITFVDDAVDQSVPGTNLAAASTIGVWWEMTLAADNAPIRSTFTSQLRGASA